MGFTTKETAEILGITPRQVSRLCMEGKLEAKKHGRDWNIDPIAVQEYKNSIRKPGPPKGQGGRPKKTKQNR